MKQWEQFPEVEEFNKGENVTVTADKHKRRIQICKLDINGIEVNTDAHTHLK